MVAPETDEGTVVEANRLETFANLSRAPSQPGVVGGIGAGSGGGVGGGHGAPGVGAGTFQLGTSAKFNGIQGVVLDPSGAVIPNVRITAITQSGTNRTTYSDSAGNFRLELEPGTYTVQAEAPGLKAAVQTVQLAGGPTNLTYHLSVGAAAEATAINPEAASLEPAAHVQDLWS